MNILHVYKVALPRSMGGIEQVIDQLSVATSKLGIQPSVLATDSRANQEKSFYHGYQVMHEKTSFTVASCPFSWKAYIRFKKIAKEFDLIHYHFPWPFMDFMHCILNPKLPAIITYHSDIVRQKFLAFLYAPLMHFFLSRANVIIATSPNYLASSPILNRYSHKVQMITYGIEDCINQVSMEHVHKWQAKLPKRFFLFIGVLRYYKGLSFLLEALKQHDLPVVIVGSGPEESNLKALAQTYQIKQLYFVGYQDEGNKLALLSLAYAMVFPSHLRSEAFGISLLEGAVFSKPLISTEIGTGSSFINVHQDTGLVVPPANASSLGGAMQYLWDNPEEAIRMGRNARKRYLEQFTLQLMAQNYTNLYHSLQPRPVTHGES